MLFRSQWDLPDPDRQCLLRGYNSFWAVAEPQTPGVTPTALRLKWGIADKPVSWVYFGESKVAPQSTLLYSYPSASSSSGVPFDNYLLPQPLAANVPFEPGKKYLLELQAGNPTGLSKFIGGIELPAEEYRGRLLVLVDSTIAPYIKDKLEQFKLDLIADGYSSVTIDTTGPREEDNPWLTDRKSTRLNSSHT